MRELLHEAAGFILFPRVVNVGDVYQETDLLVAFLDLVLTYLQYLGPIRLRKAVTGGIVRRGIKNDKQGGLFFQKFFYLSGKSLSIELLRLVKE